MENATKALLIAAAVLIAILLISLGVGVFNTASEQMGEADLSEYQIQQHNDKFRKFEGKNVSGSEVNALITTVFNHNNQQEDETGMKVTLKVDGTEKVGKTASTSSPTKVATGSRYTVSCTYNTASKLITDITVTTNK